MNSVTYITPFKLSSIHRTLDVPKVSIVLLNFNGALFIKSCLQSIEQISYPCYELILVDNCSNDGSIQIIKKESEKFSNFKLIGLKRNVGYAAGNNIGARFADNYSKYVLFLNIDTQVTPDFLNVIVNAMEDDSSIGASQPKLLLESNKKHIDSMGAFIDVIGGTYNISYNQEDKNQYPFSFSIFYAKGAALFVRKELFNNIGGFDDDFFLWRDEVDLCWRIWLSGYKVINIPSSVVYHYGSAIIKKTVPNPKMEFYFTRNNIRMLIKNYELNNLIKFLPLFLLFRCYITSRNSLKSKNPLHFLFFYSAIFWNLKFLRATLIKRFFVKKIVRKVKDKELIGKVISKRLFLIDALRLRLN